MRTVKAVNQPLPLAGGRVSVKSAEGVACSNAQVFEQIKGLGVVGHHDHPGGANAVLVRSAQNIPQSDTDAPV